MKVKDLKNILNTCKDENEIEITINGKKQEIGDIYEYKKGQKVEIILK